MKVSRSALLPYSSAKMFDVVTDIRSYPGFLNWCNGAEIISETEDLVVAKLIISYGKLNLSFTTQNTMVKNESVQMNLVDGPFSSLTGQWLIQPLNDDACKVSLEMEFMFENRVTHKLLGRVFQGIVSTQLDAFQKRADDIYS